MSRVALFTAAAAGGSIAAALCFCWTARFLRNKKNTRSGSGASLSAASKVGLDLSLAEEPAPAPEPTVEDVIDEAPGESHADKEEEEVVVQEIQVEDPEAEETFITAALDASHDSSNGRAEEEEEGLVGGAEESEIEVQDAIDESQEGSEVSGQEEEGLDGGRDSEAKEEDKHDECEEAVEEVVQEIDAEEEVMVAYDEIEEGQEDCLDGGKGPEAEEEDAGGEGEEVVEDDKLVELSGLDCLVGVVDSEEKQVFLSEECRGDASKGSETYGVPYQDTGLVDWGDSEVAEGDAIEGCVDAAKDGESVDVGDRYLANGDEGEKQDQDFKEEVRHEELKEHLNEEDEEHLKSNDLEVPIEGPTTEARLVVEVVNGTIFYMDPITKNNRGFSLLKFMTLDEAKQHSILKNSLVNDTSYRVAHNHTEAGLVEVVNQTKFYTDPVTKKNNGFSLLQFPTLDKAERGVSVFMNQLGNGTPKQDREPQDGEPEEEILMDVSNRGGRFPPPEQIHGLKPPRASRHVTQRGMGFRTVASEGEGHHMRGS